MQKIRIDFDNPGLPQHISAVENDSQSRFFQATLYENGKAYTAPAGASYSIMYRGFGPQNQGWYDTINDGAGKRAACKASGNVVTCEIARQALQVPGHVSIVLCVTTGKGYMLKSWPIECDCKNDRYDSTAEIQSFFYITQVSNADWNRAIQALEELKNTIDPTLSLSGKAADAAKVGEAINAESERAKGVENQLKEEKADKTDLDIERKRIDVLNDGGLNLKDEVIDTSIKAWLTEHPEATTTVQDGSIEETKINKNFLQYIKKRYITPEMYGCVADGKTDNSENFNELLKNTTNEVIVFSHGTYCFSNCLDFHSNMHVILNNTTLKCIGENIETFIALNKNDTHEPINGSYESYSDVGMFIKGKGFIDCNYNASIAIGLSWCRNCIIDGIVIKNFNSTAIKTKESGYWCAENIINNVFIYNENYVPDTVAIEDNGGDSTYSNILIEDITIGLKAKSSVFHNIHMWCSSKSGIINTIFAKIMAKECKFSDCYIDTVQYGFVPDPNFVKNDATCGIYITNLSWYVNRGQALNTNEWYIFTGNLYAYNVFGASIAYYGNTKFKDDNAFSNSIFCGVFIRKIDDTSVLSNWDRNGVVSAYSAEYYGKIDMHGGYIVNVREPINSNELVNKKYADSIVKKITETKALTNTANIALTNEYNVLSVKAYSSDKNYIAIPFYYSNGYWYCHIVNTDLTAVTETGNINVEYLCVKKDD